MGLVDRERPGHVADVVIGIKGPAGGQGVGTGVLAGRIRHDGRLLGQAAGGIAAHQSVIAGGEGWQRIAVGDALVIHGDGQREWSDVRRGGSSWVDNVVAGIGSRDCDAGHGNRFVGTDVLVVEGLATAANGETITSDPVTVQGDGGGPGAIVNLVAGRGGNRQNALADVRCAGCGGVSQGVIGRVGASKGDSGHRDRLVRPDVLGGKASQVFDTEQVAGHSVVGQSHRCGGRAVVRLVAGCGGYRKHALGDGGCGGGGVAGQRVVGGVFTADADSSDGDRLVCPCVLGGEPCRSAHRGDLIAAHSVVVQGDQGAGVAIVDLVRCGSRHGERSLRNTGRGGGGGGCQRIVGSVNPCDAQASHTHQLACAHILVCEGGRVAAQREVVAHNPVIGQVQSGDVGAVIHAVLSVDRHVKRTLGNAGGGSGAGFHVIVRRIGTADTDTAHIHGFACAGVLIGESGRGIAESELVATDPIISQGDGGQYHAIIGFIGSRGG